VTDKNINFTVNGETHTVEADATKTLLQVLRDNLDLTGSKDGCSSGDCGACVVLVDGQAENSCMILSPQIEGADVKTVEGIAGDDALHPLQKAFAETWAFQCGFCTPGMLISCYALLQSNPEPSRDDVLTAIAGNFCRCTGYQAVVNAVQQAAAEMRGAGSV